MNSRTSQLITVVIPAHNADGFIADAISSVLAQTHSQVQLVVVDDGSTDMTVAEIEAFDDPRLILEQSRHSGVCGARNRGLALAEGDMIAFLDADDTFDPAKLSIQRRHLDENPRIVAVGSLMRYESVDGRHLGINGQDLSAGDAELIADALFMPFPLSSILFRTSAVRQVGGFDETLPGLAEDLDLLARLAKVGDVGCVPDVLGAYRVHKESASVRQRTKHRMATRFVRDRISARKQGEELDFEEYARTYRPTFRQRYGDRVQALYRKSGESAAAEDWLAAITYGLAALAMGPRYTVVRLLRQQRRRSARVRFSTSTDEVAND